MGRDTLRDKVEKDPDIVCGDDGFYVWWPVSNRGAYSPHHLRMIADVLDEKNAPWAAQLEEYMANSS